jgi:hypothetical protein
MNDIVERLDRIEQVLQLLVARNQKKDFYTTDEISKILNKAPFTVREWCRHGRLNAQKRRGGRGQWPEWVINHDEIVRYQKEGLLPVPKR